MQLKEAKVFVLIESDHNTDAAAAQAAGSSSLEDQVMCEMCRGIEVKVLHEFNVLPCIHASS